MSLILLFTACVTPEDTVDNPQAVQVESTVVQRTEAIQNGDVPGSKTAVLSTELRKEMDRVPSSPNEFAGLGGVRKGRAGTNRVWEGMPHVEGTDKDLPSNDELMVLALDTAQKAAVRREALINLGNRKCEKALDLLETILLAKAEAPELQRGALNALFVFGGVKALPIMFKVLEQGQAGELRATSLDMISRYSTKDLDKALRFAFTQTDNQIRATALRLLWDSGFDAATVIGRLMEFALETDQSLWQEALDGLRDAPHPEAGSALRQVARKTEGLKQQIAVRYYRSWLREFPDLRPE